MKTNQIKKKMVFMGIYYKWTNKYIAISFWDFLSLIKNKYI